LIAPALLDKGGLENVPGKTIDLRQNWRLEKP
jgi:hypothetical protein